MPEGHTIHRLARQHRRVLRGKVVGVDSPQGRFARGAALLDGQKLDTVDAHGKHLFYRWSNGEILHVHLGLFGKFHSFRRDGGPLPVPTTGTRLRLITDEVVIHLAGPACCEVLDPATEERILDRLGPDPLRADAEPDEAWAALQRRTIPIGAALLDQKVVAGIGNVFRAEALFLEGVNPDRPARALTRAEFGRLWSRIVTLLRAGERSGRIATVDPREMGTRSARSLPRSERVYVYKRAGLPCRRCGTTIVGWESALRTIFACPRCQPDSSGRDAQAGRRSSQARRVRTP